MSLSYLIDGYNVINHIRLAHLRGNKDNPQKALVEFIITKRLCGSIKNMITVVFDGFPKAGTLKTDFFGVSVVFSREESADELIKRMLEKASRPRTVVVVSDDKEIRFFARMAGANVRSVTEFTGAEAGSGHKGGRRQRREDLTEPKLSYSDISSINKELRERWLKE